MTSSEPVLIVIDERSELTPRQWRRLRDLTSAAQRAKLEQDPVTGVPVGPKHPLP